MKPRVFIGSSTEGRDLAHDLQANLDAQVTAWDQDIFRPSEFVLQSLLKAVENADFGVFIFSADDEARIRGERTKTIRDNVLFEMGLFVGRLGLDRTIIVRPRGKNMRIASDLA